MGGRFDVESIREEVESISSNEQAKIALTALSAIHDRWVRGNLKKFEDPGRYSKRYMFMPLPLIGFEAVRSDLVFLEEILREIGMKVTERDLYDAYTEAVVVFRHENRTSSRKGLIDWLMFHLKEYRAEDEYIVRLMQEHYEAAADVADQVIERLRGDGFMFLL